MTAARRVLVVDDEPSIRTFIGMVLEDEGFAVELAADGCEALARARDRRPDVIVLDLMMPAMNGWELIALWRRDLTTCRIPIVVMSAGHPTATASVLGVQAFLGKPFDLDRLLAVLVSLFDERH